MIWSQFSTVSVEFSAKILFWSTLHQCQTGTMRNNIWLQKNPVIFEKKLRINLLVETNLTWVSFWPTTYMYITVLPLMVPSKHETTSFKTQKKVSWLKKKGGGSYTFLFLKNKKKEKKNFIDISWSGSLKHIRFLKYFLTFVWQLKGAIQSGWKITPYQFKII